MHSGTLRLDRRGLLRLGGAALLLAGAPAIARAAPPLTGLTGTAFGTTWRIALPAAAETVALRDPLATLLGRIDAAFSPWRADGTIGRFNAGDTPEFAATDEVVEVTRAALAIAGASGGRFDPTVGPLVGRWGFGPIRDGETPRDGWRMIAAEAGRLSREDARLTLDLCGIAKGHALDCMTALLLDAGHDDFLVDLGGELAARGRHPSGRAWRVGVENPSSETARPSAMLALDGAAVATSGDRVNGYDLGGRRYSHIIDPATGEPAMGTLASVSVLMPLARDADGWATALMAAEEDGPALARANAIPALFQFRDGDGLRSVTTGGIEHHLI